MFTGLIEACAEVRAFERRGAGARLALGLPSLDWKLANGESLAVSGCCLTVAGLATDADGTPTAAFDLSGETLTRTWFGELAPGKRLNLERALRLSDRLGGHLVSGHVDGVGSIAAIEDSRDGGRRFSFEVPAELERYLIDRGSITVDGISLTVVAPRGRRFDVAVIPETLARTSFSSAAVGARVNLEADSIGKWVERLALAHTTR